MRRIKKDFLILLWCKLYLPSQDTFREKGLRDLLHMNDLICTNNLSLNLQRVHYILIFTVDSEEDLSLFSTFSIS